MSQKKVTIRDIAKEAGVSVMTVSYVLNQNPNQTISAATTKKVLDAANKLHYIPSNAAKALRSRQTFCVGIVLRNSLSHYRYSQTIDGIRDKLEQQNYSAFFCSSTIRQDNLPEYAYCYLQHKIDGLIYIGENGTDIPAAAQQIIKEHQIPVVALDCRHIGPDISTVDFNYYNGAFDHAVYLLEHGAKQILYLRPETDSLQERERESGLKNALYLYPETTLKIRTIRTSKYDNIKNRTSPVAYDFLDELSAIVHENCPSLSVNDAILCSWGIYAEAVYANAMAVRSDLQIASLTEGALNIKFWKNLSYTALSNYEVGSYCASLAIEKISGGATRHEMLDTHLITGQPM